MLGDPKVYRRVAASLITLGVSVLTFDPDSTYKGMASFDAPCPSCTGHLIDNPLEAV